MRKMFYSLREVSEMTGFHFSTIDRWARAGSFPPKLKFGSRICFAVEAVDLWIASRQ